MAPDVIEYPLLAVRDVAVDAMIGGSCGWFVIPAGGTIKVDRLERKQCYRVTLDVRPRDTLESPELIASFVGDTRRRIESLLAKDVAR